MNKLIQRVFQTMPPVPHDEEELKYIVRLLDKVPLYEEKISQLAKRVEEFAKDVARHAKMTDRYEIEKMIFRAFFIDLENRKFATVDDRDILRLKANIVHEGVISRRNVPCEVCGENRSIDQAHIIPRKIGGPAIADNLLFLCPTHHRLFDRFMLSRAEYVAIDWERKSASAQHYAQTVILAALQKFWERIESGHYQQLGQHEENTRPFVKYAIMQLLQLFKIKQTMKRSNIYSAIGPHLRDLSKKIVSFLVKEGVLRETKYGAVALLSVVKSDLEPSDAMVLRLWQKL